MYKSGHMLWGPISGLHLVQPLSQQSCLQGRIVLKTLDNLKAGRKNSTRKGRGDEQEQAATTALESQLKSLKHICFLRST